MRKITATVFLLMCITSQAAIISFSSSGSGTDISISENLNFTITANAPGYNLYGILIEDAFSSNQPGNFNGGGDYYTQTVPVIYNTDQSSTDLFDAGVMNFNYNDVDPNDFLLLWDLGGVPDIGSTFTVSAGTYHVDDIFVALPDNSSADVFAYRGNDISYISAGQNVSLAVPEPSTVMLLTLGGGIAWLVRLKQRF